MKLCFFVGHRDAPETIRPALEQAVWRHIEEHGVRRFVVGNHGNFDRMARQVLTEAKKRHPDLDLRLAVPYPPSVRSVSLPRGFDGVYFPPELEGAPSRGAAARLDRLLLEQATHLIAYVVYVSVDSYKVLVSARERAQQGLLVLTELRG